MENAPERFGRRGIALAGVVFLAGCDTANIGVPPEHSNTRGDFEVVAPAPPSSSPPPLGALDATAFGAAGGQDSRAPIQAALDAAGPGGAVTVPPAAAAYLLTSAGPNPLNEGGQYALRIPADVTLHIAAGATLELADHQQTDEKGPVDLIVWDSDGVTVTGGGTIRGNTVGQPGWSGGHQQITAGCLLRSWRPARRAVVSDLYLIDAFSNPVNLESEEDATIARIRSADVGEGPQVIFAHGVTIEDIHHTDAADVSVGDGIEVSHVVDFAIRRVLVEAGVALGGSGGGGGAGIDVFGSANGTVNDFRSVGQAYAIELQDSWLPPYPATNDVVVRRALISGASAIGLLSGARSRGNTRYEDVKVNGCGTGAWIDGPGGLPPLVLRRVTFEDCHGGLVVSGSRAVVASQGEASRSTFDGISVTGNSPSLILRRFASRLNGRHGVHVAASDASILIEGGSFLGNLGGPYSGLPPDAVVVAATPAP